MQIRVEDLWIMGDRWWNSFRGRFHDGRNCVHKWYLHARSSEKISTTDSEGHRFLHRQYTDIVQRDQGCISIVYSDHCHRSIASGSTFALGHCMQRAAILFLEIATDVSVTDTATNQLKL
jgi:hypothetical protein